MINTREAHQTEPLSPVERYRQFTRECYQQIRLFKRPVFLPVQREKIDPVTHLYPTEVRLRDKVLDKSGYLSDEEHAMVEAAAALTLLAHAHQFRDSGGSYAAHPLRLALMGIKKHHGALSICKRLLHDTHEDTWLTYKTIRENIHPDVADGVKILSKIRGRHQRKEMKALLEEKYRLNIFKSLIDSPDETIIKIDDRLHSMRTLGAKSDKKKREIIFETEQIYIPLARRMGLHDEANELEHLCLIRKSPEHEKWARDANRFIKKFFKHNPPDTVIGDMRKILGTRGFKVALHSRIPSAADFYRRIGELRPLTTEDMYLYIDAAQHDFGNAQYDLFDWGFQAVEIANALNFNRVFDRPTIITGFQFKNEVQKGLTDSLVIDIIRLQDRFRVRVMLYPHDVHVRERISLASLLSSNINEKPALKAVLEKKQRFIAERIEEKLRGQVESSSLIRGLEPRLPEGHIRVTGVDDKSVEEPWSIKSGSTVMDYIADITPLSWYKAVAAMVNGNWIEVPDYVLQAGDKIHVDYKGRGRYDPLWIHCFKTSPQYADVVRSKIRERMFQYKNTKNSSALYLLEHRVKRVGKWRLRTLAGLRSLDMRLGPAMDAVRHIDSLLTEDDFYIKVGLGELTDSEISPVVDKLADLNRNLVICSIDFQGDRPGQLRLIGEITERLGVNVVGIRNDHLGEQSIIVLSLDPSARNVVEKISREIRKHKDSVPKGLKAIRLSANYIGATEELLFLRRI